MSHDPPILELLPVALSRLHGFAVLRPHSRHSRLTRHRLVIERDLDRVVSRLARPKGHAKPGTTEGLHLGGHVDPRWRGDEDL
jgi:hypothetical protein